MVGDSFEFRGVNFREKFGIRIRKIDYLLPPKRARKRLIPGRHGMYDFGSECFDERIIRIECDLLKSLTRAEVREISALLKDKGKLILWDEPDKHYMGEVYTPSEIEEFPKAKMRTFTIEFICEPFAYSETKYETLKLGSNDINYNGTIEAPCIIRLTNNSNINVKNITIKLTYRRK
ncbi:MAG: phage tail family protein [Prevotellaceae bacterium]|nr:phage tail family protein [Prevotellaceae bacterium]